MRIDEIEERKAAIATEMEAEGANLDALLEETRSLNAEAETIKAEAEKREALRKEVAEKETATVERKFEEEKMEERTFAIDSMEYRNAFLKNLKGEALTEVEQRAFAESGSPVPTLVADKFFEKMKKLAPMLSEITLFRVAGALKFFSESVRDTADKHTENAAITAGANDAFASVTLGGIEFAKLISISKAAKAMSIDAFEGWLVDIISGDLARAVDNYILNDTTHGVAAITYTTGTNQILNTASTGYTYKNFTDLVAKLPAAYDAEAKFIVNKATLYGQIANITNSNGNPLFVDTKDGWGRILGYPVVVDDYVSTANNAVYLGKWTDIVGNMSEDPSVERNDASGFRNGSIDFRGMCVFDSAPAKTDGIVRLVSTTA